MNYYFNALLAAAAVTQEVPIDGQTGVWVKLGTTVVASGMTISGFVLQADAARSADVYNKGKMLDVTVVRGIVRVSNGGVISGESVPDNAAFVRNTHVYSGGTAYAVTLGQRGNLNVSNGGIASGVTVNSNGTLNVSSGGTALAVTSNAGATVNVLPGGYIEYA